MLQRAARELHLALDRSFVVGDRWSDIEMAPAIGAQGVLVRTGYGAVDAAQSRTDVRAAHVADNLMDATAWILREHRRCA
jgi:histidinol phosphatase-like enzyme